MSMHRSRTQYERRHRLLIAIATVLLLTTSLLLQTRSAGGAPVNRSDHPGGRAGGSVVDDGIDRELIWHLLQSETGLVSRLPSDLKWVHGR